MCSLCRELLWLIAAVRGGPIEGTRHVKSKACGRPNQSKGSTNWQPYQTMGERINARTDGRRLHFVSNGERICETKVWICEVQLFAVLHTHIWSSFFAYLMEIKFPINKHIYICICIWNCEDINVCARA